MTKKQNRKQNNKFVFLRGHPYVLTVPFVLAIWFLATQYGWVGASLLAKPSEVGHVLMNAFVGNTSKGQNVFLYAVATIQRALTGWGVSVGIGIVGGLIFGSSVIFYKGFEPILEFARSVPPIMVFPVFLVGFNYGEAAYIWTIVYGCFPIVLLTVARGAQRISNKKLEILRVYSVKPIIRAFAVVMEILPSCFLGARLALSVSLVIAVVTEMVFSPRSGVALGALAKDAEISFETPLFYAALVVIGAFGYLANVLIQKLEDRLWFKENSQVT